MTQRLNIFLKVFFWIFIFVGCGKTNSKSPDESEANSPQRIVTLTPSATSLVVALGEENRIVGRDKYSIRPEKLLQLPVVGDFMSPNIEAIAALTPDLVILDESQESAQNTLKTLDIRTLTLQMHTLSDVRKGLIEVGKSLRVEDKAKLSLAKIDGQIEAIRTRAANRASSPRVLLLIDRDPDSMRALMAAGPNTYIDELLRITGARNVMAQSPIQYPPISAEVILRTAPDIIIDLSRSGGGKDAFSSVAEVPAVANGRLHFVNNPQLSTPSPKVGDALESLFALTEFEN